MILWSVANETPVSERAHAFLRTLVDDARALDDTRLVTAAMEHHDGDATTHVSTIRSARRSTCSGFNEYVGWYDGLPEKCDTLTGASAYHKPLVISEFGADAKAGLHGDALTRFSEEYQAGLYRHQLAMLQTIPGCAACRPGSSSISARRAAPCPASRTAGIARVWSRRRHEEAGVLDPARRLPVAVCAFARSCAGGRCRAMMRRRMSRSIVAASLLVVLAAGCAPFDPPPPAPIRPTDRNVVVAWTIEEGLYDNGLARATEIIQFRYQGGADDGVTEIQDYGRLYRGDQRARKPTIYRRHLTSQEMEQLQHVLAALELPDLERRQGKPELVPWTMWGICVPVTRGTQCGQLLRDEWRDVGGAPQLFGLLESSRRDARLHPDGK